MTKTKNCGNCQHYQKTNRGNCKMRPLEVWADMCCPDWQEKQSPADYKPGNGPFWAERIGVNDYSAFGPTGVFFNHLDYENAKRYIDGINKAVKAWLDEKEIGCDHCLAGQEQKRRWICCRDNLPPPGSRVLTYEPRRNPPVMILHFAGRDNSGAPVWSLADGSRTTHWLPLPDAPEVPE